MFIVLILFVNFISNIIATQWWSKGWVGGGGSTFTGAQMYFYYTNRGAHIYLPRAAIPPAQPYLFIIPFLIFLFFFLKFLSAFSFSAFYLFYHSIIILFFSYILVFILHLCFYYPSYFCCSLFFKYYLFISFLSFTFTLF